jgi:hypothetical protein
MRAFGGESVGVSVVEEVVAVVDGRPVGHPLDELVLVAEHDD